MKRTKQRRLALPLSLYSSLLYDIDSFLYDIDSFLYDIDSFTEVESGGLTARKNVIKFMEEILKNSRNLSFKITFFSESNVKMNTLKKIRIILEKLKKYVKF